MAAQAELGKIGALQQDLAQTVHRLAKASERSRSRRSRSGSCSIVWSKRRPTLVLLYWIPHCFHTKSLTAKMMICAIPT